MIDYNRIRAQHSTQRFNELINNFYNKNPIFDLNTGIIDNNKKRIELSKQLLELSGQNYIIENYNYLKAKTRLNIAYLLHSNLAMGGIKVLIEQANNLKNRGYDVSLYSHLPKPEWIEVKCKYYLVPFDRNICDFVPNADIVIAGYWDLIIDALKINAPIKLYMAQGDIDIFEYENLQPLFRNIALIAHSLPVKILTVSKVMQRKLKEIYDRESVIIPNAIDDNIFYPATDLEHEERGHFSAFAKPLLTEKCPHTLEILIVGNDTLRYKGFDDIINALSNLKAQGYDFIIKWITPTPPTKDYMANLNIDYYINPHQNELGKIYRATDILLCSSYYEAFSLPPLEAMASGVAVITSENEGVKEYAINNENCLMFEPGNIEQLTDKIKLLLNSSKLRKNLMEKGLKTSKNYTWQDSIDILEKVIIDTKNNLQVAVLQL